VPFLFKTWRNQEQDLGPGGYEPHKRGKLSDFADPFLQPADVPIFLATMNAKIDYLVLKNWVNFVDDSGVVRRANLTIEVPGNTLDLVRRRISSQR
jgi:hypothetical protein